MTNVLLVNCCIMALIVNDELTFLYQKEAEIVISYVAADKPDKASNTLYMLSLNTAGCHEANRLLSTIVMNIIILITVNCLVVIALLPQG